MCDFYEVLQVPVDVDTAALKAAYLRRAEQLHPDRQPIVAGPSGRCSSADGFKQLQWAYEVLSNPRSRALYDQQPNFFREYRSLGWTEFRAANSPSLAKESVCRTNVLSPDVAPFSIAVRVRRLRSYRRSQSIFGWRVATISVAVILVLGLSAGATLLRHEVARWRLHEAFTVSLRSKSDGITIGPSSVQPPSDGNPAEKRTSQEGEVAAAPAPAVDAIDRSAAPLPEGAENVRELATVSSPRAGSHKRTLPRIQVRKEVASVHSVVPPTTGVPADIPGRDEFDFRLPVTQSPRNLEPQPTPWELKVAPIVDPRQFELPRLEPPSAPWRPREESPNVRRLPERPNGTRGENFNGYSTPPTQLPPHALGVKRPSEWSVNKWQSVLPSPPPSQSRLGWK